LKVNRQDAEKISADTKINGSKLVVGADEQTGNLTITGEYNTVQGKATVQVTDNSGGGEIGLTWTAVDNAGSNHLYGIAYGGGTFVAVGQDGETAYSADGATWTAGTDIQYASAAYGIAYGNGTFVAVGSGGVLAYSTDGGGGGPGRLLLAAY
jgi:hypothetical protein